MVKIKIDPLIYSKLLSGILCSSSSSESYSYLTVLLEVLPVEETCKEIFLITSSLEQLHEIYLVKGGYPSHDKDKLLSIISNNLYGVIKETKDIGLDEISLSTFNRSLNVDDEVGLSELFSYIIKSIEKIFSEAISLNYTIEDSRASLPVFLDLYMADLYSELAQVITVYNINESYIAKRTFWGWSKLLNKYKIMGIDDIPKLLRIISTFADDKRNLIASEDKTITTVGQISDLEAQYKLNLEPLGSWTFPVLDRLVKLTPKDVTILVGAAGIGKTTVVGCLAGILMAQGKKIVFYCPEITRPALLFAFVLPSYIYAKYGFMVTSQQLLGEEQVYEYGSDYSIREKMSIIQLAKAEFAEDGLFTHIATRYSYYHLEQQMRSHLLKLEPDVFIFDHTTEIDKNSDMNQITESLARTLKIVKHEFMTHFIINSHTGSDFKIPTKDVPIVRTKIVAWSKALEGAADNLCGMFRNGEKLNIFFTKLRWSAVPPGWIVFRMDKEHNVLKFLPSDQVTATEESDFAEKILEAIETPPTPPERLMLTEDLETPTNDIYDSNVYEDDEDDIDFDEYQDDDEPF